MPDYYQGVYEMEELLKSESLTLKDLEDSHLRTLLNEFVSTADGKGISLFESLRKWKNLSRLILSKISTIFSFPIMQHRTNLWNG